MRIIPTPDCRIFETQYFVVQEMTAFHRTITALAGASGSRKRRDETECGLKTYNILAKMLRPAAGYNEH